MVKNMKQITKEKINITLDIELLEKIDSERGLIPRSTIINEKLKQVV